MLQMVWNILNRSRKYQVSMSAFATARETIESITLLAYTAEAAEWDNRAHLRRIKGYTYSLFNALGVARGEAEMLALACVLHDVGKSFTSDELLKRQGKYTAAEWQAMEQHTVDGEKLLRDSVSPILRMGATVALTHHERWNGSGYPNGTIGTQIPLSGRVCALADVFDALTTRRLYKEPIDLEEALALIRSSSGTLFDPSVVQAFIKAQTEILNIYKSRGE